MSKKPKFAVVLAGSGVFDGSEIHEATLSLYAIMKNGGEYEIFAPDINQHHVINHITGEEMKESRNVLIEASRINRGAIKNLKEFKPDNFDAILFPGGFGAAKNLSSFAFDGPNCKVNSDVENAIRGMKKQNKPIGALCISPVIVTKVLENVEVTIGQDKDTAKAIESMGGKHKKTNHGEVTVDKENNVFTTPCYMLDANILQIGEGADNVVKAMMEVI
ncbi:MAG: isoprenoid biosynthesis glyoxalase ElbB [Bacteroidia bacterium]